MSSDPPVDRPENARDRRSNAGSSVDEPVVTEKPSSRQPRSAPPAGSEPQGRITLIAALAALVVIALVIVFVLL